MECKSVQEHLLDYLEDGQKDILHSSIQEHLGSCPQCRRECEKLEKSWSLLDSWNPIEPHPSHRARFWETVAHESREGIFSRLLRVFRKPAFVGTIAVALLMVIMAGIYTPGPDLFLVRYSPWSPDFRALSDNHIASLEKSADERYSLFAWNDIMKVPDYLETAEKDNDEYPDLQFCSKEVSVMDGAHEVILDIAD
jgi:hypothetical protein